MKWEPADFRVGLLIVGAATVGIGSFVWLSPAVTDDSKIYYADFDAVEGLNVQSEIKIAGYSVGRVGDIVASADDNGKMTFRVRMRITPTLAGGRPFRIPEGTVAKLMPPAFVGSAYIALETPIKVSKPLPPGAILRGVQNQGLSDKLQELAASVGDDVKKTLRATTKLVDSLQLVASQARTAAVAATDVINTGRDALPGILASANRTLGSVDSTVHEFKTLSPALKVSLDSVNRLVSDTRRTINQVSGMMGDREPEIARIAANLDSTAVLLRWFVQEVAKRPMRAITGVTIPVIAPPPSPAPVQKSGGSVAPGGAPPAASPAPTAPPAAAPGRP
jgi:ABC-type transporter Mla subunit MlaD